MNNDIRKAIFNALVGVVPPEFIIPIVKPTFKAEEIKGIFTKEPYHPDASSDEFTLRGAL